MPARWSGASAGSPALSRRRPAAWLSATTSSGSRTGSRRSRSLPLDGTFDDARATAFFGGLLPEGQPRDLLARRLGVSAGNDYSILVALGGDTAGAISVLPPGDDPTATASGVEWLDEDQLGTLIDELPNRPMHADADGEWRLSLAGAQDKLPVVVRGDGTVGLTHGRTPSTHIIKTPIARLDDTVANEAFCLHFGVALDPGRNPFRTVEASPIVCAGRDALLVARYDRSTVDGETRRLHQEDLCQALGIPTLQKYESEGGPGIGACVGVLRGAAAGRAVAGFVDYLLLSFLVGNHDAHGKNYALLYGRADRRASLAPAYDVLSTVAYQRTHDLTRKMAMQIGGEYRPEYLRARHLTRMCEEAEIGLGPTRRRIRTLAARAPTVAAQVHADFVRRGWDRPILNEIVAIIGQRAQMLLRIVDEPPGLLSRETDDLGWADAASAATIAEEPC